MRSSAVILFVMSTSLFGQDRITISSIEVEPGTRIPARVVEAETTLETGKVYSQTAIRRGVDRVKRLPFVLDATYQLLPVTGGTHRLVITVAAATSFTYDVDARGNRFGGGDSGVGAIAAANLQSFLGSRSLVEGVIGETGGSGSSGLATLSAGYTAFDLFGLGARLSIMASQTIDSDGEADVSPRLTLFVPITVSQSIQLTANRHYETFERSFASGFNDPIRAFGERKQQAAALQWLYQTTDDPYFTRSGWDASVGPELFASRVVNPIPLGRDEIAFIESETTQTIFSARAAHFWPVADRWMTAVRTGVAANRLERRGSNSRTSDSRSGSVAIGIGRNFGDSRDLATGSRNRLELSAGINFFDLEGGSGISQTENVSLTWTHRSRWGRASIAGAYSFD